MKPILEVGPMRTSILLILLVALSAMVLLCGCDQRNPRVLIKTELGDITVEIYVREAPITATNFLTYVREGRFEGATFYRTVTMDNQPDNDIKIEVIQGGLKEDEDGRGLGPIEHETTAQTGVLHKDGTVSMARLEPGTASSEIFICVNDQSDLDFGGRRNSDWQGFAAFGQVVDGMETVRVIHLQPAEGQYLNPEIEITGVVLLSE
jgi:peptidyl-prolyl cis-trans isomerase A (cyclophilin A)